MPRLSRSDTEHLVRALQHLLAHADGASGRNDLRRLLDRLTQRTTQSRKQQAAAQVRRRGGDRSEVQGASPFTRRRSVEQVEEGSALAPRFDRDGLLPCITTDAETGEVLMLGYMNSDALQHTLRTGEAHYWSRSRRQLWRKGATSGLTQHVVEMRIDDDQDALWLRVRVGGAGASCHVGYRSCFYRSVAPALSEAGTVPLTFTESVRVFDPRTVYGDAPTPTRL